MRATAFIVGLALAGLTQPLAAQTAAPAKPADGRAKTTAAPEGRVDSLSPDEARRAERAHRRAAAKEAAAKEAADRKHTPDATAKAPDAKPAEARRPEPKAAEATRPAEPARTENARAKPEASKREVVKETSPEPDRGQVDKTVERKAPDASVAAVKPAAPHPTDVARTTPDRDRASAAPPHAVSQRASAPPRPRHVASTHRRSSHRYAEDRVTRDRRPQTEAYGGGPAGRRVWVPRPGDIVPPGVPLYPLPPNYGGGPIVVERAMGGPPADYGYGPRPLRQMNGPAMRPGPDDEVDVGQDPGDR